MDSKRKLISIVFSDIKGYTSLMHRDEAIALKTVKRYEDTITLGAQNFNGTIINFMGDGALIIFNNTTDALDFGIHIQQLFTENNPIPHRVGIHTGEGIIRGNKIYGDSVNIASRIESISVPGALLISDATYQLVKNQEKYNPVLIGNYRFKNINEPMKVYALKNDGLIVPKKKQIKKNVGNKPNPIYYFLGLLAFCLVAYIGLSKTILKSDLESNTNKFDYTYPKGNSYFLGIGIDKYDHWDQLNNAVNDVQGVSKTFKEYLGFDELLPLIVNEEATKENLVSTFTNKVPGLLNPDDRLIVFYAGHGYTQKIKSNSDSLDVGYLVPHNASVNNAENLKNYLNIDSFLVAIGKLPPNNITVILDACQSGFAISEDILKKFKNESSNHKKTRLVITSADKYQTASDDGPIKNHSLFTGKLIEGLENSTIKAVDDFIEMRDLGAYLQTAVSNYSEQTPRVGSFFNHQEGFMKLYLHSDNTKSNLNKNTLNLFEDSLETIAVIPFENLSNDLEFQNFASYLESTLFQFLSEVQTMQPKFKTITPRTIKSLNRGNSNVAYSSYSSIGADIILSGQLFKLEKDKLIIKPTILNAQGKILGVFQDIIVDNQDMRQAAFLLKQRLKTFFLEKDDLNSLTVNVPDYRAFLYHKKALEHVYKDHDKVRSFASQALEIDSNYLDAHLTYLYSYLDYERNYEKAEIYAASILKKFRDVDLTNYQRQRLNISVAEAKRNYTEIYNAYNSLLKQHPKDQSTIGNTIVYAYNANHLSDCKNLIDNYRPTEYYKKRKGRIDNIYIESLWNQDSIYKAQEYILRNDDNEPGYFEYNLGLSYAILNDITGLNNYMEIEYQKVIDEKSSYAYFLPLGIGKILLYHGNNEEAVKYFDIAYKAIDINSHLNRALNVNNLRQSYSEVVKQVKSRNINLTENSSTNFYIGVELLKAYAGLNDPNYIKLKNSLTSIYEKEIPHLLYYGIAQAEAISKDPTDAMSNIKLAYAKGREFRFPRYKYDPYFSILKDNTGFIEFNSDKSL